MDILQFINSRNIRNHLKSIDYPFSTLEVAWIIYHSNRHTLYEKLDAFEELIQCYPDCEVKERVNTRAQDSLFEYITEYIAKSKEFISEFTKPNKLFFVEVHWKDGNGEVNSYIIEKIFDNFEVALEQCKLESEREVFKLNIKSVSIFNKASGEYYYSAEIGLRATDLEIMDIHYGIDNYEKYGMLMGVFGGLWFDFPTPFKVGDIVRNVNRPRQPLVLYRVGFDDMENQFFNREYNNDEKDMAYGACYTLDDGSVISDLEWNYMDLEYYTGELEEEKRC